MAEEKKKAVKKAAEEMALMPKKAGEQKGKGRPVEGQKGEKEQAEKAKGKPEEKKKQGKEGKKAEKHGFLQWLENNLWVAVAIVCIVVVVAALAISGMPEQAEVDDFWNGNGNTPIVPQGTLKMIVVTSNRCPGCEKGNSLENLFLLNGINYQVENIEESSPEGQQLISSLGIEKLPAYIIDEKSLDKGMQVKTKVSGFASLKDVLHFYVAEEKGSYGEQIFVFPEMNLDQALHSKLWLGEKCGTEDEMWVQFFLDPYDPNYIKRASEIEAMRGIFSSEPGIEFRYDYIYRPTYSYLMLPNHAVSTGLSEYEAWKEIEFAGSYLSCASDVGNDEFKALQQAIYSTYCEIGEISDSSDYQQGLNNCEQSSHYNIPLSEEELEVAEDAAGLDPNINFNVCVFASKNGELENQVNLADNLGIVMTPTVFVGCQYEVPFGKERFALCIINKDFSFC